MQEKQYSILEICWLNQKKSYLLYNQPDNYISMKSDPNLMNSPNIHENL